MNRVAAIKNGDEFIYEQVFNEYHAKLYFFILKKTSSEYLAEEVVQLTFIKLWNYKSSLNEDYTISTQLFRIASTTLIDLLRKQSNNRSMLIDLMHEIRPEVSDPGLLYNQKEFLKQVTDVINRMPEMQRKTFQMSRVDGLSYNEIAEKLSISIKTVEVHIGRALKKIRKQLPILVLVPWIYFLSGKG